MPMHPVHNRPMTSGERSTRSLSQQRQMLGFVRLALQQSADLHLQTGHLLAADGHKEEAQKCFQMAEIEVIYVSYLNIRLAPYEDEIKDAPLPDPAGEKFLTQAESLILEATDKQRSYAAKRADRRPAVAARYGHLAKSESSEATQ